MRGLRLVSNPWIKAIATLTVIALLLYWLRDQMPFLARGFQMMGDLDCGWVTLALVFSFLSMSSYASVQKLLLRSAGVVVGYWNSLGLILASNAISTSIPGGQVLGATLTYRRTRQWGASPVIASWQLVVSGILATVGIVLLALLGFFLVGRGTNPVLLTLSAIGLLTSIFVIQWAARHPEHIEGVLLGCLAWINRRRRKSQQEGAGRVRDVLRQAEVVELSPPQLSRAFGWSLLNWLADIGCLWAASMAVGAEHSVGGLAIAYVAGKIVATAPVTPGGLGTVEVALVTALTASGLGANVAFATVFIYRIVSFVLVALAGWLVFALFYRNIVDPAPVACRNSSDAFPLRQSPVETPARHRKCVAAHRSA